MITSIACTGCALWVHQTEIVAKNGARLGHCRARAPQLVVSPEGKMRSTWPFTTETDFCGEHVVVEPERAE